MAVGELVAGAVIGGLAGDAYAKTKEEVQELTGDNSHGDIPDHFRMMIKLLSKVERNLRRANKEKAPDVWQAIVLTNNNQIDFNNRGYRHCWLLCTISFKLDYYTQAGRIQYVTAVGWNNFDLPMKSQMQIDPTDIANTQVILFFSNDDKNLPGLTA